MKRDLHADIQMNGGLNLNVLTDDQVNKIHLSTLELLDQTGVFVEDKKALDCFESGGARVDRQSKIVQIPPHLVEEAIRSAPSKVTLAGRDRKHDLVLEGRRVHFTNFSEGVKVIDLQTGKNRTPVKQDLVEQLAVTRAKGAMFGCIGQIRFGIVQWHSFLAYIMSAQRLFTKIDFIQIVNNPR